MITAPTPSPKFRKMFGVLQLAVAVLAIVGFSVQRTQADAPHWTDLMLPLLVAMIGLQIFLFETHLSQFWRFVGGAMGLVVGAMLFTKFFV